ncbi:hypothetical protein OSTOST_11509 [Ostertagia ostertagi]
MLTTVAERSSSVTAEEIARGRITTTTDNSGDGAMYVDETPPQNERLYQSRATTDILDTNKELLQEYESVSAGLRLKMISLSNVAHEGAQQQMKNFIEMLKNMDRASLKRKPEAQEQRPYASGEFLTTIQTETSMNGSSVPHVVYGPTRAVLGKGRLAPTMKAHLTTPPRNRGPWKPEAQEQRPVEEFNPDDIQCCIICFRRIPDDNSDRDFDEWVKCSTCGLWAHESCSGEGTPCPYDEGTFNYS